MSGTSSAATRRQRQRQRPAGTRIFRICVEETPGRPRWLTADLVDHSDGGLGIALATPLTVGTPVSARGRVGDGPGSETLVRARVAWCLERPDGSYRAGLAYDTPGIEGGDPFHTWRTGRVEEEAADLDYYEVLQLSGNADPDTIHRVYRILAQRYHPDNKETGSEEMFKQVLHAYRVLSDPEKRAAYDVTRLARRQARWRIFQHGSATVGVETEQRKRRGVLELLYTQRINEPDQPFLTIHTLEELLGCPRDHLQVSLWYLKEKGFLFRSDNGRYSITATGVDETETHWNGTADRKRLLLPEAPAGKSVTPRDSGSGRQG